jgi:HEAT repeat protein
VKGQAMKEASQEQKGEVNAMSYFRCRGAMCDVQPRRGGLFVLLFSPFILLFTLAPSAVALESVIDSVMYQQPKLVEAGQARHFSDGLKPLWVEALARPELDNRLQAAESIGLGHKLGMKGLQTTSGALVAALDMPKQDPAVVLAIARALIVLDAREYAPQLFKLAQGGNHDLCDLIEPALAHWDYQPMREVWLKRLGQREPVRASLILAIDALGEVHEEKAVPRLRELALSRVASTPVRLAAARALGKLRTSGLETDARGLAADLSEDRISARLVAAALLRHHAGEEAVKLLQQLAGDDEPAVIAAALDRLTEIDAKLVLPVLSHILPSPDARVQLYAVEVLYRLPTEEHIRLLGDRLDHPHPAVRVKARTSLFDLAANHGKRDQVIRQGTRQLQANGWRGQEQSIVLLAQLDHKPAGGRLLELLEATRPEVGITAAWALRRLAVPATLPNVFKYLSHRYEQFLKPEREGPPSYVNPYQLTHLIQLLGLTRYRTAEGLLMRLVPRYLDDDRANPVHPESRAAAAWALGLFSEEKPVPGLAEMVEERLNDIGGPRRDPEDPRVRRMSAVTLGRIKARQSLKSLRRFYGDKKPTLNMVNNACGWAIEQITGEKVPAPGIMEFTPDRWFLSPIESTTSG